MNKENQKINTPLCKTAIGDLYIQSDYVYTISDLQNIF